MKRMLRGRKGARVLAKEDDGDEDYTKREEEAVGSSGETVPHMLSKENETHQAHFKEKKGSNLINAALKKAKRKGGFYLLSGKNQRRCLQAKMLRLK